MYLLDANAFMEASRHYYASDIAPGFWAWLGDPRHSANVASVSAVRDEIAVGSGDLVEWARRRPPSFWLKDDIHSFHAMQVLSGWAVDPRQRFHQAGIDEFLDSADLSLVAQAMALGATVVTREQPAPASKKKIKIPDVCDAFDVAWADPFNSFRSLGMRLVA